jgi:hypothetical protein
MGDPKDIFNVNSDPFGPYRRHEERLQDVAGSKIATREIYTEIIGPDGIRQICAQTQYLCQGCGRVFVVIGQSGLIADSIVMCQRCARIAKLKFWLKPLWSIFVTDRKEEHYESERSESVGKESENHADAARKRSRK